MYIYLFNFINKHNVAYNYQFGFRQQYSTSHAMIGVYLDLKKAFDTVDHNLLLKHLSAYRIRGNILEWFRSYLVTGNSMFS